LKKSHSSNSFLSFFQPFLFLGGLKPLPFELMKSSTCLVLVC